MLMPAEMMTTEFPEHGSTPTGQPARSDGQPTFGSVRTLRRFRRRSPQRVYVGVPAVPLASSAVEYWRYVLIDATTTRASIVMNSMPTSETRTHASITMPLSSTRSNTSMMLVPVVERSSGTRRLCLRLMTLSLSTMVEVGPRRRPRARTHSRQAGAIGSLVHLARRLRDHRRWTQRRDSRHVTMSWLRAKP